MCIPQGQAMRDVSPHTAAGAGGPSAPTRVRTQSTNHPGEARLSHGTRDRQHTAFVSAGVWSRPDGAEHIRSSYTLTLPYTYSPPHILSYTLTLVASKCVKRVSVDE